MFYCRLSLPVHSTPSPKNTSSAEHLTSNPESTIPPVILKPCPTRRLGILCLTCSALFETGCELLKGKDHPFLGLNTALQSVGVWQEITTGNIQNAVHVSKHWCHPCTPYCSKRITLVPSNESFGFCPLKKDRWDQREPGQISQESPQTASAQWHKRLHNTDIWN